MADASLDQIWQLLGALSAQVTALGGSMGELKAEVLSNRVKATEHREREIRAWEQVEAELRNVKHEHRNFEQKVIALDSRLWKVERVILAWQAKMALITGGAAALGGLVGIVADHLVGRLI